MEYEFDLVDDENNDVFNYDSDCIDSDVEEMLYAAVHHQTIDSEELVTVGDSISKAEVPVKEPRVVLPKDDLYYAEPDLSSQSSSETADVDSSQSSSSSSSSPTPPAFSTPKVVNNRDIIKKMKAKLYRRQLIEDSLKQAENRWNQTEVNYYGRRIPPSSERTLMKQAPVKLDLSFNNGIELSRIKMNDEFDDPLMAMNHFYTHDDHDSDEERETLRLMPRDSRFWQLDAKDLYTCYRPKSNIQHCDHCFQFGHKALNCPKKQLICSICGEYGHIYQRCRNQMCSYCFSTRHLSRKCTKKYDAQQHCSLCKLKGHDEEACTYQWRRFLNITDPEVYQQMLETNAMPKKEEVTPRKIKICYNCGAKGHFAHDCNMLTINNKRHEIPSPLFDGKIKRNEVKNTKHVQRALNVAAQVNGKRQTPSTSNGDWHNKSSNSFHVSIADTSDKDSDDSVDYAINLLKASTSKTPNKKRSLSPSSSAILNLSGDTIANKARPKKKLKKNYPKGDSSTLHPVNGTKKRNNGYATKRYYNNFKGDATSKKKASNKNNNNNSSFQGQQATPKPKKKKKNKSKNKNKSKLSVN